MSTLARNIFYNLVGQSTVLLLGFIAVRFIYQHLGGDAVGIIFFALTLNNVLTSVMDLGMSSTIVREVATTGRSIAYVEALLRTAGFFYWTMYCSLAVLLLVAAGPVAKHWLNIVTLDTSSAEISFRILSVGSLLALPRSLYASLFRGFQRMELSNGIEIASAILLQAGIAATIVLGGNIVAVSWWICASTAATVGAYALAASRFVPVRALLPRLDMSVVRLNRSYASRVTVLSVLAMIHTHADKLIVSRLLPLGVFGLYGFGFNALNRGMLLTGAVTNAAFPRLAEMQSSNDRNVLLRQYNYLQDLVSYAMAAVFGIAPFVALPMFSLLFGDAEANLMFVPWTLLALGFYMNATLSMPYILSLAIGKPGIALSLNAWAVVAVLPLTIVFVHAWGLNGAAFSWVFYHVFAYVYMIPRVCRECANGEVLGWYLNVAKFLLPATVIYTIAWFVSVASTGGSFAGFLAGYASGTVIYGAIGWRVLSPDARDRIRTIVVGSLRLQYGR